MSRSVHQTVKRVFGGKTLAEIRQMVADRDEDVLALLEKERWKRETKCLRALRREQQRP